MKTIIFDVMYKGRFIMQYKYRWCPAFSIDLNEVIRGILLRRPSLKGKQLELYITKNVVK